MNSKLLPKSLRVGLVLSMALTNAILSPGSTNAPPDGGDGWSSDVRPPSEFGRRRVAGATGIYGNLTARVAERHMVVRWTPPRSVAATGPIPVVRASTDTPGKRVLRDWRPWPMKRTEGGAFEARIPVPSVEVPTAYFLSRELREATEASPVREFWPRLAGMTEPTEPFRGFVEGFEDGASGWELVTAVGDASPGRHLRLSTNALSGGGALRVEIPPGRGSVTVGTVRVRGWMLTEHPVEAIRVAARTESGEGRLGCVLHSRARAGADDLAVHPARGEFRVLPAWQRLEVPVEAFVGLRPYWVDWLTLQFFGDSGGAVLLDDLELVLR